MLASSIKNGKSSISDIAEREELASRLLNARPYG